MHPRYRQQIRALGGDDAQAKLGAAKVALVGVGATGSAIAQVLARAGVGSLRLIDRDLPELSNLQRQVLYDERDVEAGLPKAVAAANRLSQINSEVALEVEVADLAPHNAARLLGGVDLVLDGTDNFLTRLLINDACLAQGTPWVYVGVVGAEVHSFPVLPGSPPCFRCYLDAPPPPEAVATCDTAGVLGSAVLVAGGLAATEALKLLVGATPATGLFVLDTWYRESHRAELPPDPDCPACAGRFDYLEGQGQADTQLCGRDAVLLRAAAPIADLGALAERLAGAGCVLTQNAYLLRFDPPEPGHSLTVFADGRAIVHGTQEPTVARSLYARYVGG